MHFRTLILVLIISHSTIAYNKPGGILDLLSWDTEEGSEVEKRDESSNNDEARRACMCNGGPSCTCCLDFNTTYFDFGEPGCVHMKYISKEEGISVNISYGENLLHSQQVKGENPEPICMSILSNLAKICARFSNLVQVEDGLKGCLQLEPKLFDRVQAEFNLGCFAIGPDGIKQDAISYSNSNVEVDVNKINNNNKNETEAEPDEFNEEELIAAVNETAEQGLVFFGTWLGLFDKPKTNTTQESKNSSLIDDTNT